MFNTKISKLGEQYDASFKINGTHEVSKLFATKREAKAWISGVESGIRLAGAVLCVRGINQ